MGTANEGNVQGSRQMEIINVGSFSVKKARIFHSLDTAAYLSCHCHRRLPRQIESWIPRRTAALVEELARGAQRVDQALHVVMIVVKIEARSDGRRNSKHFVQRLSTVMPGAHGDSLAVEDRRDVVRMYVCYGKTDDSIGAVSRLHALDSLDFFEHLPCRSRQDLLMLSDRLHSDHRQIVNRGCQGDGAGYVRSSSLELQWNVIPSRGFQLDLAHHFPARHER